MAQGYMYALMLMYAWLHVCTVTQGYMYAWMTQTQKHTACIGNQESLTNRRQAEALSLTAYTPHAQMEDHNPPRLGQIIAFLERAGQFEAEDSDNVIAVCAHIHTRVGTGVKLKVICKSRTCCV